MTAITLEARIARHHEHAVASYRLEEELGTRHGIGWTQFVLLDLLDAAGGHLPAADLASRLGLRRSQLVLQLMPMEKLGLLRRSTDRERRVSLGAAARRLVNEARETAAMVCAGPTGSH